MATDLEGKLAALQARKQERQTEAATKYLDCVYAVCDDTGITEDEIAEALSASGRTMEQLRSDCELLEHRRELSELMAAQEDADTRAATLQEQISKIVAQRDASYGEFTNRISSLACQRDQLLSGSTRRLGAKQEMIATSWPHLRERAELLKRQLASLGIAALEDSKFHWEAIVRSDTMNIDAKGIYAPSESDKTTLTGHLRGAQAELDQINRRLGELYVERDEILRQLSENELEQLIP